MKKKNSKPHLISTFLIDKTITNENSHEAVTQSNPAPKIKKELKENFNSYKKWNDEFKELGFSNNQTLGHDRPHCINCNYTFVNFSLRQSKLEDHFKSNHEKTILKAEEHIKIIKR